ncbi:DnaJ domain-containing protein [Rhodovulum sp. ES.010]|uniref:J domain-containing protein n=1 Tax=Rhodovulum sp. ES.010 TaxID=1882821 RepID=UPI00092BD130|nr:J domain-containing protein [Rhodovulum sp. ES.010]SIO21644.1 DnaJ domain-containing protein [Rhodovulum sp. ES.010]
MSPIERVRARAAAVAVLGLGYYATENEIRQAWHRIALECHPDRDRTQMERFTAAKHARDSLLGPDAQVEGAERSEQSMGAVMPRRVCGQSPARGPATRRPQMQRF